MSVIKNKRPPWLVSDAGLACIAGPQKEKPRCPLVPAFLGSRGIVEHLPEKKEQVRAGSQPGVDGTGPSMPCVSSESVLRKACELRGTKRYGYSLRRAERVRS